LNHDVLILGGGAIGLSIAYELASRGRRVGLLERNEQPGSESSWAGAGIVPPGVVRPIDPPLVQLGGHAAQMHPHWARQLREETGIDNGYRVCGALYLADDAETDAALEYEVRQWQEQGIRHTTVDAAAATDLEPALSRKFQSGDVRSAYHLPDEAQLRNPRHVRALAEACRRRGVEIIVGAEVEEFRIRNGRLAEVATRAGRYAAEQFVLCTGAWTGELAARFGTSLGVKPIRGQIVLLKPSVPVVRGIVYVGRRYFVPRDDGLVLVGSTEEDVGFDRSTTDEVVQALRSFAYALCPALESATVERAWAGLRPHSADDLPYLGAVPAAANLFVAAGHYRWGLTLSPVTAVVISQLLCGEPTLVDLTPFRLDR